MKSTIVFCVLSVAVMALARPDDKYTDKYDNVNVQEIVDNDRLLEGYVKCMLDKGPCTSEGEALKAHLQDAIQNDCAKCTDIQKSNSRKVMKTLINKHPAHWNDLTDKYDKSKEHAAKIEAELKE